MDNEKELLTKEEVWNVLTFANSLYGGGVFTPQTLNSNLVELNNNQKMPTLEAMQKALLTVRDSGETIRKYAQAIENTDMIYRRTINYYANMLSFDLSVTCKNAENGVAYRSKEYKKDLKIIHDFLDKFDYKAEFKKVAYQILRNEIFYTWFRNDTKGDYALQILPQDRCLLTGVFERGLLFDFDMNYFLKGTVDINEYPSVFKTYYMKTFSNNGELNEYNPTAKLSKRDGVFATYHQTSPEEGAWCWKFDMSNFNAIPYLSPMMQDSIINNQVRMLQRDKDIASAYAMLIGEIALLDNAKSGEAKDNFAINPSTLGTLLQLVQSGLSKNIKVGAMPVKENEWYQYEDKNPEMYSSQLKNSAGLSSSASRVIYSASDKLSQSELYAMLENDGNLMRKLYAQFQNFLEYYTNMETSKYKFSFHFDGIDFSFDRQARFDRLMTLADKGVVFNSSVYASAIGMKPQEFDRALMEGHNSDLTKNLSMLLSIHTQSSGDDKGGRPIKKSGLTDGGATARDY